MNVYNEKIPLLERTCSSCFAKAIGEAEKIKN